jgi:hypothetical protein
MPETWQRVIFVSGAGRSGTSWVGDILKNASDTAYIFEPLTHTRHQTTMATTHLRSMLQTRDYWTLQGREQTQQFAEMVDIIRRHVAELYAQYFPTRPTVLILKQPGIEWIPLFRAAFDPTHILCIERNPIAILNSYVKSNLYQAWRIASIFQDCERDVLRHWPDLHPILERAKNDKDLQVLGLACVSQLLARKLADEPIVQSYESLAVGGIPTAVDLAERLGLQFPDPNRLRPLFCPDVSETGFLDTRKNSVDRASAFIRELPPWILRKAQIYLTEIGYETPPVRLNWSDAGISASRHLFLLAVGASAKPLRWAKRQLPNLKFK